MKKGVFMITAVALAAGVAVGIAFAAGAVGGGPNGDPEPKDPAVQFGRPLLLPAGMRPLRVKGRGFKAREHVTVRAAKVTRKVQANDQGSFVATLKGVRACDAGTVTAKGDRGSRASFNISSFVCRE